MRLRRLATASDDYLNEIRDQEGRPLGEMRAVSRDGVDMPLRPCPYAGTRHGLPMATASLAQVSKHWTAVIGAAAALRTHYLSRGATPPLSSFDLWRIGKTAESVPAFMLARADRTAPPLPAATAALFKSILGINAALSLRFVKWLLDGGTGPCPTPATLLEHSEARNWLIGDLRVCAGSESMIRRLLDVLANGDVAPSPAAAAALPADIDALYVYAHHLMRLALVLEIVEVAAGLVAADLFGAIRGQRADGAIKRSGGGGLARVVTLHDAAYGLRQRDFDSRIQSVRRLTRTVRLLDDGSAWAAAMNQAAERLPGALAEPSPDVVLDRATLARLHSLERRLVKRVPLAAMVAAWAAFERIAMLAARSTEQALAHTLGDAPAAIALARLERPRVTAPIRRAFRELFGVSAKHQAAATHISIDRPTARPRRA
jgi:hypothetical protein